METHKNLLDNMEHWLQQDASLLAMTNEVDYDQDGEKRAIYNYKELQLLYKGHYLWNTVNGNTA